MDELVQRWTAGALVSDADTSAREFADRVAECSALLVRIAYSVLRNRQDAEDVAQEAFIRASRRRASLREPEKVRAWLVRVTWRLALDWRRSRNRRGAREDAAARLTPLTGNAEADVARSERADRLWAAIDALPADLRLVIVLQAIHGHAIHDIATLLGVAEGTVKSRLFTARQRLQEYLS